MRSELLAAWLPLKAPLAPSNFVGPLAGTVFYAYYPATSTYWAMARFGLVPGAGLQAQVSMQDGGAIGIFHHLAGEAWQATLAGIPYPCPNQIPVAVVAAWDMTYPQGCSPG